MLILPFPNANAVPDGAGNQIFNNYNVGIGTTAPNAKLNIVGGNVGIGTLNISHSKLEITGDGATELFRVNDSGENDTTPFIIQSDGNVGVGTTRPIAPSGVPVFHISNKSLYVSTTTWVATFETSINDTFPKVQITQTSGLNALLGFNTYKGNEWAMGNNSGTFTISSGREISTNQAFNIRSDGNVGIGTITPGSKLSVISGVGIGTIGSAYVSFSAPNNGLMVQGNVGIGSLTPGEALDVTGNIRVSGTISGTLAPSILTVTGNTFLATTSGNVGIGTTTPQGAGLVVTNGNVGIGTWAPVNALDLIGNIKVSGTSTVGKSVLTATSAVQNIVAGVGLSTVGNSYIKIAGSGGPVIIDNAVTQVAAGTDGQELVLYGTSDTNTVKFHDGDGLSLTYGVSFIMGNNTTLRLIYNSTGSFWREISRSANN